MLGQDATDPLPPGRILCMGELAAAPGRHAVHVGLVRVAVRRIHVVVVVIVAIVVVIVVVLLAVQSGLILTMTRSAPPSNHPKLA